MSTSDAFEKLKSDIISHAGLVRPEATGFYSLYCPVCQKESKKTGGFVFQEDSIGYNCFRGSCDASCVYEVGNPIPRKFRRLMDTIGVTIPLDLRMVKSSMQKAMEAEVDADLYEEHRFNEMQVPKGWVPLDDAPTTNREYWEDFFTKKHIPLRDIFFIKEGQYRGLAAIGIYYFDKLIGFQIATGGTSSKYISHTDNEHMVYFPDRYPGKQVIVVEGLLDAKCFPMTCGVMRDNVSRKQAYLLRGMDVVLLPDRTSNNFLPQMKKYGWKMCIPPWTEKDLQAAVQRYGVMVVARMIKENTTSDPLEAEIRYRMWVEND